MLVIAQPKNEETLHNLAEVPKIIRTNNIIILMIKYMIVFTRLCGGWFGGFFTTCGFSLRQRCFVTRHELSECLRLSCDGTLNKKCDHFDVTFI